MQRDGGDASGPGPHVLLKGRYRILRPLGGGGMADVYLAQDEDLPRQVVVKIPKPALATDRAFRERFAREIRSLLGLEHAHVTRLLDAELDGEPPFIVLPWLEGGSLRDRLEAGPLPLAEILRWLPDVARALDSIHERGWVHRDVKPGNILFDAQGDVFLGDFGVVRSVTAGTADGRLTDTGTVLGSPAYVAPEALWGEPPTPSSDQYSLGVVVYQALTGRIPHAHPGEHHLQLLARRESEPAQAVADLVPSLAGPASAAVMRTLATDPARRFPDCETFARALEEAHERAPEVTRTLAVAGRVPGGAASRPRGLRERLPQWRDATTTRVRRAGGSWRTWALIGALLAAGVGVVALVRDRDGARAEPPPAPAPRPQVVDRAAERDELVRRADAELAAYRLFEARQLYEQAQAIEDRGATRQALKRIETVTGLIEIGRAFLADGNDASPAVVALRIALIQLPGHPTARGALDEAARLLLREAEAHRVAGRDAEAVAALRQAEVAGADVSDAIARIAATTRLPVRDVLEPPPWTIVPPGTLVVSGTVAGRRPARVTLARVPCTLQEAAFTCRVQEWGPGPVRFLLRIEDRRGRVTTEDVTYYIEDHSPWADRRVGPTGPPAAPATGPSPPAAAGP